MPKELKFENKYIYLSFAAGALYYLAYYFKFPNSYGLAVSFILLTLLIRNFKKIEGTKIIIYSLIISLITLALSMGTGTSSLQLKLVILSLNIAITLLMIFGLKGLRKWGLYLSVTMVLIGLISVLSTTVTYNAQYFGWTLPNVMFNLKIIAAMSFSIASMVFLIKFRKSFSSKRPGKR